MLLLGTVSSRMFSINTKSGLDVVVLIFAGSVDGGESEALHEGISANSLQDRGVNLQMEEASTFRTESCLHACEATLHKSFLTTI